MFHLLSVLFFVRNSAIFVSCFSKTCHFVPCRRRTSTGVARAQTLILYVETYGLLPFEVQSMLAVRFCIRDFVSCTIGDIYTEPAGSLST